MPPHLRGGGPPGGMPNLSQPPPGHAGPPPNYHGGDRGGRWSGEILFCSVIL